MKVYAGSPAAARAYLEADRGRADDYYLAEGTGWARRFVGHGGRVGERASLSGDLYQAWVAGQDPASGEPRGRLRTDGRAVRFVEVVINGPKSWSLAAALHSDIAAAYDAAQDRAAVEIVGWLSRHATTRVGPRGGQVQVPVEVLEAVTVRHYTSRAGDPHRHLHLQVGARVFAAGKWRGLHTVGVRDFLAAINGVGHAAVACDPQFRVALAAHGYTVDETGEILQLAEYIGPFSARAAQIGRNADRYEREWMKVHPGEQPGPVLRRAWDARAWADGRPDKVIPRSGADLTARWRAELAALGYRDPARPVGMRPTPVGELHRDQAAERILTRLGASRSAWNAADIRGEAERLVAAEGIIADAAVRTELAEDLTARALARCFLLLEREELPEHIRAWTSRWVLDVEADLTERLATRSAHPAAPGGEELKLPLPAPARLDAGQAAAVTVLAGDRALVVLEGAAGAGKTTTLAATRQLLQARGRRLVMVTPTLKAARVAAAEVGSAAGSAAWLAFHHGWRWNDEGVWTRLEIGRPDPVTGAVYAGPPECARLRRGDLLVVDEAGMLDQDTARALLTIADECGGRLALLGDRHQLAAVGRGGVLDLAAREAHPAAVLTLGGVHRFTRTDATGRSVPDGEYAELTLAMRTGANPGAVFDALVGRGQIRIHPDPAALRETLAALGAGPRDADAVAVVVDTGEQANELNAVIRDRLIAEGRVDDDRVTTTRAGQRIGAGDRVATRRNDRALGVANRDTWTVTAVREHGEIVVVPVSRALGSARAGDVIPGRGGERVLAGNYVGSYVELAHASTAHGMQGDTVRAAHVVVGEHTGAASAYVGMTRGRTANTAHLVAADLAEAREQWIAVFGRDRADLGPGHAAELAAREAARHATARPLEQVLADLHQAWTAEQRCLDRLAILQPLRDALRTKVSLEADRTDAVVAEEVNYRRALRDADRARQRTDTSGAVVAAAAGRIREAALVRWDVDRTAAAQATRTVLKGAGRLVLRRAAVARAGRQLSDWANTWRPYLPDLPTAPGRIAQVAGRPDARAALEAAFGAATRRIAEEAHPEHAELRAAADAAQHAVEQARRSLAEARRRHGDRVTGFGAAPGTGDDAADRLAGIERDMAATRQQLTEARRHIAQLAAEPALLTQPPDRLTRERDTWRARRATEQRRSAAVPRPTAPTPDFLQSPPRLRELSADWRSSVPPLGR
ncbi:MobF family relaxase [Geodermatophilus sp. URMC 64]